VRTERLSQQFIKSFKYPNEPSLTGAFVHGVLDTVGSGDLALGHLDELIV